MISRYNGQRYSFTFPKGADHIQGIMRKYGWYERRMLEDIKSRLTSGSLAIDVGAYIGTHTVWMAGVCKLKVLAFEPNRIPFNTLGRNIRVNRLEGLATPFREALGAAEGYVEVETLNETNTGMTITLPATEGIRCRTIDSLKVNPAVIKIDVEGAEEEVLRGSIQTLERCHPLLYVEAAGSHDFVAAFLADFGYKEFGVFNATPTYGFEHA